MLYLSNAEQYWATYSEAFIDNVLRLSVDDASVVLRTKVFRQINDYTYLSQPLENFRAWLCGEGVHSVYDVYGELARPRPDRINFVRLDREPPPARLTVPG